MMIKPLRNMVSTLLAAGFLLVSACSPISPTQSTNDQNYIIQGNAPLTYVTGTLYSQPVDINGAILLSAWLDPDGSDNDQYIWDSFTLQTDETITDIEWFGLYDPMKLGAGGAVVDFSVSIYPSIAAGTEPAIANPPLVKYMTGGNAGESPIGTLGAATLYSYSFSLPAAFYVVAGAKYWIQIEAFQHGINPDWCFAAGSGGNGYHYRRTSGAGGDVLYRTAPGDAAFTLWGPVLEPPTPTDTPTETPTDVVVDTPTDTPTNTPTDTVLPTATDTPTSTPTDTALPTATDTPTSTPTSTSLPTATDTPTNVPTNTPTDTPTATPVNAPTATQTPTDTPTSTPTDTPTSTPTYTPTNTATPTPLSNTSGKVNGGGAVGTDKDGSKATFGFTLSYSQGDPAPKGHLTYQDHTSNVRLKATTFDRLSIEGNHVWISGTGTMNDGKVVSFIVEIDTSTSMFTISIPALNGYTFSGNMTSGTITIH